MIQSVYLMGVVDGCYKIGKSKDPDTRLKKINTPSVLEVLHTISSDSPSWLEKTLHEAFSHRHRHREWFALSADEVAFFKSLSAINCEDDLPEIVIALRYRNRIFHDKKFAVKKRIDLFTQDVFTIDEAAYMEGLSVRAYTEKMFRENDKENATRLTQPIIHKEDMMRALADLY